jgi:hypothetical protein
LTPGGTRAKAPPFVKVTIRGPYLPATIVITDRETLDALSMDALEDFSREVVPPAAVEPGYHLVRYVQGPDGVVRVFDRLRYRANPQAGWCGYIEYLGSEPTTQSFYAGSGFRDPAGRCRPPAPLVESGCTAAGRATDSCSRLLDV